MGLRETPFMPHTGPMDKMNCCWNMRNVPSEGHNEDCLTAFGPLHLPATMAVTFTDGQTIIYKNVNVCVNTPLAGDGIKVTGTRMDFETMGGTFFTLLGVRQYTYTLDMA